MLLEVGEGRRRAAEYPAEGEMGSSGTPARERCPRCGSRDTKFCYYNNYNTSQPRHFCKSCRRYWTLGGSLRNVPIGGASRKRLRPSPMTAAATANVMAAARVLPVTPSPGNSPVSELSGSRLPPQPSYGQGTVFAAMWWPHSLLDDGGGLDLTDEWRLTSSVNDCFTAPSAVATAVARPELAISAHGDAGAAWPMIEFR